MGRGRSKGKIDNLHSLFVNSVNNPRKRVLYTYCGARKSKWTREVWYRTIIQRYKVMVEVYVCMDVYMISIRPNWSKKNGYRYKSNKVLRLRKETIDLNHGVSTSRSSSSCNRGRLEGAPMPIPLASNTFMATLAAPSDVFFVLARVLRSAPNA